MPMAAAKRFCFHGQAAASQPDGNRSQRSGIEQHGTGLDVPVDHWLARETKAIAVSRGEQLEQDFQPLDAFVVFFVKRAGLDLDDPELREGLFDLLLESRYRLVDILSGEVEGVSGDPLRDLFIADWEDLRSLITRAGQRGLIRGRLLD